MNSSPEIAEPPLNTRELLGLLSARMIHSLSNRLVVITGNICAAVRLQEDPAQAGAALRAALQAANDTGALLEKYATCRRNFHEDLGHMSLENLVALVRRWVGTRKAWTFELDLDDCPESLVSPLSSQMLIFVLDSIAQESKAVDGAVRLMKRSSAANRFAGLVNPGQSGEWIEISIIYRAAKALDWAAVRTELTSARLAAAYEVLAQIHAKLESRGICSGVQSISLQLPLAFFAGPSRNSECNGRTF